MLCGEGWYWFHLATLESCWSRRPDNGNFCPGKWFGKPWRGCLCVPDLAWSAAIVCGPEREIQLCWVLCLLYQDCRNLRFRVCFIRPLGMAVQHKSPFVFQISCFWSRFLWGSLIFGCVRFSSTDKAWCDFMEGLPLHHVLSPKMVIQYINTTSELLRTSTITF